MTPQDDSFRRDSTKPRTAEPSQPPSQSSKKPKKDRDASAFKIERPSIHTITEPGEPSSSTLTPDRAKRLQADDNKPLSPNPVQHISDYQKPNRNQTPAKQPMKVMVVEDDPIKFVFFSCFRDS
jgi:hypothetical protein